MKTPRIKDGDFDLLGGQYVFVEGPDKLKQDLSIALREEYGHDRFHPRWGSLLQSYIGQAITPAMETTLRSEVQRVISNYMLLQRAQISRDTNKGIKPAYGDGEVVRKLTSVSVAIGADTATLTIRIEALSRQEVTLFASLSLLSGNLEVQ